MKKLFLTVALATAGILSAQQFGVKAGINIANVSNSDGGSTQVGPYGGIFMNKHLSSAFSIQPELLFNAKGTQTDYEGIKVHMKLNYISIPVMLQYDFTPGFYMEAGPEFSFLAASNIKANGVSVSIKDYVNSMDFGLGIGAGYYFTPNIGVTARYVTGLTDIIKDNPSSASHNNVFQLGLAYKFSR